MTSISHAATDQSGSLMGAAYLSIGLALFSIQDVIVKTLSGTLPAIEIVFIRCIIALVPIMLIIKWEGGWSLLKTQRPVIQIIRGLCGFISYMAYYLALAALPLADVVTVFYASPLFITALAVPFLSEKVGLRRWMAVLAGFAGVILVVRPGGETLIDPAMLLALCAALSYAAMVIMTRRYCRAEAGSTLAFYSMLAFLGASGLFGLAFGDGRMVTSDHPSSQFLWRAWAIPEAADFGLIAICGLIAGAGFYLLSKAYLVSSTSVVAPFEYSSLPFAILWGYLFWSEIPGPSTISGLLLVVGAGLFILHREARRGRKVVRGRVLRLRI